MICKRLIRCAVSTGFWAFILLAGMSSFATAQTPLAEWKFNEGSGNEAFDSFGQGYAARLSNGVRWVASEGGWAVSGDADSRGTVSIPPLDLSSTRAVTLAFWVKRNYATDDGGVLLESGRDYQDSAVGFALLPDDATCRGMRAILHGNEGTTANCYSQPASGVWHHIALIYDKTQTGGDEVSLYVDAVLQNPISSLSATTNTNNFGKEPIYLFSHAGASQFSSGAMKNLQIYDRALAGSEIQQIYSGSQQLSPGPSISYVQGNDAAPQSPQSTVQVVYSATQNAGDLNVVVVGWNDAIATVRSVVDSKGNSYALAVGPTIIRRSAMQAGKQSIYYAKNIASASAGSNTVTVTFSRAARYPDIRILEYSGADQNNPVDVTAANSGSGSTSNSGSATTTNSTDLIFGANYVQTYTSAPGAGFTNRLLTPDGNIAEDMMVTTTGAYSAAANLTPSGWWIMQMVAFRTAATANFTISASPPSLTIGQGSYGTSTITTAVSGGFNNAITLSATGMPSGTTVSFSPNPIPAPGSGNSTMTLTVGGSTPIGTYPITVTGNGGGVQQNTSVTLTVTSQGNFSLSASPSLLSVMQESQGSSTLTVTANGGFNNPVSFSASGMPNGTTVSFNPPTLPAPGSGNSTMTITVGPTPMGTYPITVTASGGEVYQTTAVSLTVTAQVILTWNASPSPGVAGYNIYRSLTSGGPYTKINSTLDPNAAYNDLAVNDGLTYYYVTTAVDSQGQESGYSNQAYATVP
jgi:hypothetical protein